MDYESKKVFLINTLFASVIAAAVYFISKFMLAYLLPFIIASVLAFVLRKPADLLERKTKIRSSIWRCALVTGVYIFIALVIFAAIWAIIKFADGKAYLKNAEEILNSMATKINSFVYSLPENVRESVSTFISDLPTRLSGLLTGLISGIAASAIKFLPAFLISSLVTVVASFYIAKDYKRLVIFLKNLIGDRRYSTLLRIKEIMLRNDRCTVQSETD